MSEEIVGILLLQNSLLNRIEEVLAENQRLKTEFQQLIEREERFRQIAENVREVFLSFQLKQTKFFILVQLMKKFGGVAVRVCMKILNPGYLPFIQKIHLKRSPRLKLSLEQVTILKKNIALFVLMSLFAG